MLSITLRQLDYACAIARAGGLTAAAQALNVSQPALSVALAQIEGVLGQALFQRRAGGPMVPSAFGRAWLAEAERHLAGIAHLMSGQMAPQPLRLAVFEDLAPLIVAPLLAETGQTVAPLILGFEALSRALIEGEVDLALTWDLGLSPQIDRDELCRMRPQALVAAAHPLAAKEALTLADVADHPLVLTDQGLSIAHMRALFARAGLAPRIAHRCASLELMRSFAANGLGIGLSYSPPAARHSADGRPLAVRPIEDAGSEPVVLARLAGAASGEAVAALGHRVRGLLGAGDVKAF